MTKGGTLRMIFKLNQKIIVSMLAVLILSIAIPARAFQSPNVGEVVDAPPPSTAILRWNKIAVDCSGLDHTPVGPGETRVFGEQVGPCRAARAMASVHIAMFEAMNAIVGGFKSFITGPKKSGPGSTDAAVAQAAHDALVAMFPSQKSLLDPKLDDDLELIVESRQKKH